MYKYSYVYILSDDKNDKTYIGVTSDLLKRVWKHKHYIVDGYITTDSQGIDLL